MSIEDEITDLQNNLSNLLDSNNSLDKCVVECLNRKELKCFQHWGQENQNTLQESEVEIHLQKLENHSNTENEFVLNSEMVQDNTTRQYSSGDTNNFEDGNGEKNNNRIAITEPDDLLETTKERNVYDQDANLKEIQASSGLTINKISDSNFKENERNDCEESSGFSGQRVLFLDRLSASDTALQLNSEEDQNLERVLSDTNLPFSTASTSEGNGFTSGSSSDDIIMSLIRQGGLMLRCRHILTPSQASRDIQNHNLNHDLPANSDPSQRQALSRAQRLRILEEADLIEKAPPICDVTRGSRDPFHDFRRSRRDESRETTNESGRVRAGSVVIEGKRRTIGGVYLTKEPAEDLHSSRRKYSQFMNKHLPSAEQLSLALKERMSLKD